MAIPCLPTGRHRAIKNKLFTDETKNEFEKAWHPGSSDSLKNEYINDLTNKPDSSFNVSNAIWFDKSLQVKA
jgi:hypothetical protein